MSYNLFLDDLRVPEIVDWVTLPRVKWFVVRNFKDFVYKIEKDGLPDIVTFDHDLSLRDAETYINAGRNVVNYRDYQEPTGLNCAIWLVTYCRKKNVDLPEFYIHSKNVIGTENIRKELMTYNTRQLSKRLIVFTQDELVYNFDEGDKPYYNMRNRFCYNYNLQVSSFPCYTHDLDIARKSIIDIESRFPMGCLPMWYILPNETRERTNGWCRCDGIYDDDKKALVDSSFEPIITFSGKRTPIHPSITKYLVPHEYGHAVQSWIEYKRKDKEHGNAFMEEYAKIRGTEACFEYGAGKWHKNIKEVFANDFRIIIGEADAEYWPHPGIEHPLNNKAIQAYWLDELVKYKYV